MNEFSPEVQKIIELALDANLLNYIDNETPRTYFIHPDAQLFEVLYFAQLIKEEIDYENTLKIAKKGIKQYREALIDLS